MLTVDLIPPQSEAEERNVRLFQHIMFRDFRFQGSISVTRYRRDEIIIIYFEPRLHSLRKQDADALGSLE